MENIQVQYGGAWSEYGAATVDEAKALPCIFHVLMIVTVQDGVDTVLLEQVHEFFLPAKFHSVLLERPPDALHRAVRRAFYLIEMMVDQNDGS